MTPQTRALIEAAEAINKARKSDPTRRFTGKIWDAFEAAISSAKAAEEGVETTVDYYWELQDKEGVWKRGIWSYDGGFCSHISDVCKATFLFTQTFATPRRFVKRTQTESNSVVEVREKEGL